MCVRSYLDTYWDITNVIQDSLLSRYLTIIANTSFFFRKRTVGLNYFRVDFNSYKKEVLRTLGKYNTKLYNYTRVSRHPVRGLCPERVGVRVSLLKPPRRRIVTTVRHTTITEDGRPLKEGGDTGVQRVKEIPILVPRLTGFRTKLSS